MVASVPSNKGGLEKSLFNLGMDEKLFTTIYFNVTTYPYRNINYG